MKFWKICMLLGGALARFGITSSPRHMKEWKLGRGEDTRGIVLITTYTLQRAPLEFA